MNECTDKYLVDKYLGVPYKERGRDITGYDCYGFIRDVARDLGVFLPDYEYDGNTNNVFALNFADHLVPTTLPNSSFGDLISFRMPNNSIHLGILLDRTRFIHCISKGGVQVTRITHPIFINRISGVYKFKRSAINE